MQKTENPVRRSEAKILVVDDRADNLISIEAILEKDNYTIVKANSGKAALKVLLNDHDFSLILMDVQMPVLDGFSCSKAIRKHLPDIPIIIVTASPKNEIMEKIISSGINGFVSKPFKPNELRSKLLEYL